LKLQELHEDAPVYECVYLKLHPQIICSSRMQMFYVQTCAVSTG